MKKLLLYNGLFFLSLLLNAQITQPLPKVEWKQANAVTSNQISIQLQKPDVQRLIIEDSLSAQSKDIPWRFGYAIDSRIDFVEVAQRERQNGILKLSLSLKVADAKSLNFNFSDFNLSEDAQLYFTSLNSKDALGALTKANNKTNRQFSTRPLKGNEILIELFLPDNQVEEVEMVISQVVYGYRDIFEKSSKTFNSSGNCNRNTNCPEADLWQDVKRAVVLITASNNTRLCTGTLLNNVREDSTPYLLTASHCNLATNSIFVFNYENSAPNCQTNADGSLTNSVSGAFSRAENSYSDFKLFELSQKPPLTYKAYYAGWNADGLPASESTTIHHPSGDIKKISRDLDSARSAFYSPPNLNTHWQVGDWDSGTTEPGSSGAALFDQLKRVVGQLEGGSANCGNDLNDYFGKFSLSWDFDPASNRQLQFWLDPDTTNQLQLDGMDAVAKAFTRDVELTYVSSVPALSCDTFIYPVVYFLNRGNDTINNLQIEYGLNGLFNNTVSWNGSLASDKIANQALPALALSANDTLFEARLKMNPSDQDSTNNHWSKAIRANLDPVSVALTFKSDQYGYENRWEIVDQASQAVVVRGGPYVEAPTTNGITYRDSLCLYDGCFQLRLFDAFGDGFNGPFFGNGFFLLQNRLGDTLVFENNFSTAQKNYNFCVSKDVSIAENQYSEIKLRVFPNPVDAGEMLEIQSEYTNPALLELVDLQGRVIQESRGNSLRLDHRISTGVYILRMSDRNKLIGRSKIVVR